MWTLPRGVIQCSCVVLDAQHAFLFLVQAVVSVHGVSMQEQLWSSNNFGRMPS
jgi:hypothetical protein